MARMGMDVDAVESAGRALKERASQIDAIVSGLDRSVKGLLNVWDGPDAQTFVNKWWPEHRALLVTARGHVDGLGQSALNNASEQRGVSDAKGDGGGNGVQPNPGPGTPVPPTTGGVGGGPDGPQNYSVDDAIARARNEIGTARPVGYNAEGECIKSVQRWINGAGGNFGGGGVVSGYVNSGAIQVGIGDVRPGDVIQYTDKAQPDAFTVGNDGRSGVHTVMVTGVNADGTYSIIQSNAQTSTEHRVGAVTEVSSWKPSPPDGYEARVWRFGKQ